jgi:hypothetical protein
MFSPVTDWNQIRGAACAPGLQVGMSDGKGGLRYARRNSTGSSKPAACGRVFLPDEEVLAVELLSDRFNKLPEGK